MKKRLSQAWEGSKMRLQDSDLFLPLRQSCRRKREREKDANRKKMIFPPMRPAGETALWNMTLLGVSINPSNLATSAWRKLDIEFDFRFRLGTGDSAIFDRRMQLNANFPLQNTRFSARLKGILIESCSFLVFFCSCFCYIYNAIHIRSSHAIHTIYFLFRW